MPTYDYRCNGCGHEFEQFQSMSAKHLRTCPECGEKKLERLIGAGAGVIFKGSGFYQTDYRSDSYKKAAEAEKKTSKSDGAKKDSKADSKKTASKDSSSGASKGSTGSGGGCGPGCACSASNKPST